MSYMLYQVKCKDCGKTYNTAFGIVGTTQIAAPLEKCPECGGEITKFKDYIDWESQVSKMEMNRLCLHCDCSGHHLEIYHDEDEDKLYLSVEVKGRGLWSALKEAWKILTRVGAGCYEEVILDRVSMDELYDYLKRINNTKLWNQKEGVSE